MKIFNKPIDFYVKWLATIASFTLVYMTSHDIVPYNKWLGLVAASLWMTLGALWKEPSMWVTNGIFVAIYLSGLL